MNLSQRYMERTLDRRINMAGITLTPAQQDVLRSECNRRAYVSGRRAGKTLLTRLAALDAALKNPGCFVVVIAKHSSSNNAARSEMTNLIRRSSIGMQDNNTASIILNNGSAIAFHTPNSARGLIAAQFYFIDEFGMLTREERSMLIGRADRANAKIMMAGEIESTHCISGVFAIFVSNDDYKVDSNGQITPLRREAV